MLEEADGVILADSGTQQTGSLSGSGGACDLQAGDVHEHGLQRLGVGGSVAAAGALLAAQHDGQLGVAAEDVTGLGHLVEDLVSSHEGKVPVHQLSDGTHTSGCGTHCCANDGRLGNGSVADTVSAEFLVQITGGAEHAAQLFTVFAHAEDLVITLHLFLDDLADCLCISQISHSFVPPS